MGTVEKFLLGSLVVIALYLMINPQNDADRVIESLGGSLSKVFQTLQAR